MYLDIIHRELVAATSLFTLYMNMYDGVRSIYDDAKVVYVKKRAPSVTIFRSLFEKVPKSENVV